MLTKRLQYGKNDLIKAILEFKMTHYERLPTKEDWINGEMKPSRKTFQRKFGSIEEALIKADDYKSVGEFENELYTEEKKREIEEYKKKYQKKPRAKTRKQPQTEKTHSEPKDETPEKLSNPISSKELFQDNKIEKICLSPQKRTAKKCWFCEFTILAKDKKCVYCGTDQ